MVLVLPRKKFDFQLIRFHLSYGILILPRKQFDSSVLTYGASRTKSDSSVPTCLTI